MKRIENPPTPYLDHIVGNFTEGKTIIIEGLVLPPAQRITISLQTGKHAPQRDDIALHLMAKLLEGIIIRNTSIEGVWGKEEQAGHYPLLVGKRFKISVTNQRPVYIIKVNDSSFEFKHRLPGSRVNYLSIQGDVQLYTITYETNMSYDNYVPLYDDPPPPYTEVESKAGSQYQHPTCRSTQCGKSCHCEKCRCPKCKPPPPSQLQQESAPSWGSLLGAGAAAVGVIGAIGGLVYALSKSSNDKSDDED